MVPPLVYRLGFDPQTAAAGALPQAQDNVGFVLPDGLQELALVELDREDDPAKPMPLR